MSAARYGLCSIFVDTDDAELHQELDYIRFNSGQMVVFFFILDVRVERRF